MGWGLSVVLFSILNRTLTGHVPKSLRYESTRKLRDLSISRSCSGLLAAHRHPQGLLNDGALHRHQLPYLASQSYHAGERLEALMAGAAPSPSKPLVEQFRLGHAPSFPKPAGIIAKGAHRGSRCIFLSTTCRHHHHRRPQGNPQPLPCYHIPAGSGLPGSGPGRCHN